MNDDITIHIKAQCSCGQEYEEVLHVMNDEAFELTVSSMPPQMPKFSFDGPLAPFSLPERGVSLVGHCDKIQIEGVELNGNQLRCIKCGKDMMYFGRADIEKIGSVGPKEQRD